MVFSWYLPYNAARKQSLSILESREFWFSMLSKRAANLIKIV